VGGRRLAAHPRLRQLPDPGNVRLRHELARPAGRIWDRVRGDWSASGRKDLRVTNDRHYYRVGGEQLWKVEPGQDPVLFSEADGWRPLQLFGMGLASQDLDGDGYPEVVITNQGDNKLQTLDPPGTSPAYKDLALALGTLAQRPYTGGDINPSTAWHPEFQDVNNDGRLDLFLSKGNVSAQPDLAAKDPNNLLLRQADGTFREAGEEAGIATFTPSRGASVTDLNLDGLPDLVVVHRQEPVTIWRNVGSGTPDAPAPMGHWIGVRLQQPAPNVDAIGASVDVRVGDEVVTREITVGGGHASGELGWIHAGLGDATSADVRVRWPDGSTGDWIPVTADQLVTIERGATTATPFQPAP
jgi:enediyne biosynthesis protein E4